MTLHFASADRFIQLSTVAAAAVLPEFTGLDEEERATLGEGMRRDLGATLQRYIHGAEFTVPMAAYVATAHKPDA